MAVYAKLQKDAPDVMKLTVGNFPAESRVEI